MKGTGGGEEIFAAVQLITWCERIVSLSAVGDDAYVCECECVCLSFLCSVEHTTSFNALIMAPTKTKKEKKR